MSADCPLYWNNLTSFCKYLKLQNRCCCIIIAGCCMFVSFRVSSCCCRIYFWNTVLWFSSSLKRSPGFWTVSVLHPATRQLSGLFPILLMGKSSKRANPNYTKSMLNEELIPFSNLRWNFFALFRHFGWFLSLINLEEDKNNVWPWRHADTFNNGVFIFRFKSCRAHREPAWWWRTASKRVWTLHTDTFLTTAMNCTTSSSIR